jgi:hypothetical protein
VRKWVKAPICRTLKWREFPQSGREFEHFKSLRTHDLEVPLKFSGIKERVTAKHLTDWYVVAEWYPEKALSGNGPDFRRGSGNGSVRREALESFVIAIGAFRKAMNLIASQEGDFTLYALFRRANGVGNWDLVVSAPWLARSRYQDQ